MPEMYDPATGELICQTCGARKHRDEMRTRTMCEECYRRRTRQRAIVKNKCEWFVRKFMPETFTVFRAEARKQVDDEEPTNVTIEARERWHWQARRPRKRSA